MRAKTTCWYLAALAVVTVTGCSSTGAPRKWLPDAGDAQKQAFGGWITVHMSANPNGPHVQGELIAIQDDSVFVLAGDTLVIVPMSGVHSARVAAYDSHAGRLMTWTLLGALSTASHGVGAIISFPVWMVMGSISTVAQSSEPIQNLPANSFDEIRPAESWDAMKPFARFPAGLPAGVDRSVLRAKRQ